jgi:hypothetical protein
LATSKSASDTVIAKEGFIMGVEFR